MPAVPNLRGCGYAAAGWPPRSSASLGPPLAAAPKLPGAGAVGQPGGGAASGGGARPSERRYPPRLAPTLAPAVPMDAKTGATTGAAPLVLPPERLTPVARR